MKQDKGGRVVGIKNNKIFDMEVGQALNTPRKLNKELYELVNKLSQ